MTTVIVEEYYHCMNSSQINHFLEPSLSAAVPDIGGKVLELFGYFSIFSSATGNLSFFELFQCFQQCQIWKPLFFEQFQYFQQCYRSGNLSQPDIGGKVKLSELAVFGHFSIFSSVTDLETSLYQIQKAKSNSPAQNY